MTHPEWKWDNRVAIMAGSKLVAVLGSEMGADEARLIEAAPRMAAEIQRLQAQLRATATNKEV